MFNWVTNVPEIICECGEQLKGWQTKDSSKDSLELLNVNYEGLHGFHNCCHSCRRWYEVHQIDNLEQNEDGVYLFDIPGYIIHVSEDIK